MTYGRTLWDYGERAKPERRNPTAAARSGGIYPVEFFLEQFLRRMVSKNFSGKCVHHVGKVQYVIRAVTGNALSFGNEPAQHPVMALICSFLPRRKRMCKIHACSSRLGCGKLRKFRTVVGSHGFEHTGELCAKDLFQPRYRFRYGRCRMVSNFQPDGLPGHPFH